MSDAEQFDVEMGSVQEPDNRSEATDRELFEQYLEQDFDLDLPGRGDLREGVIVEIRPTELLVNVAANAMALYPNLIWRGSTRSL